MMYSINNESKARCQELAEYLIEKKTTIRKTAAHFNLSKSTVHKDIAEKLQRVNNELYIQAKEVLDINKSERHIRGGMATKRKYVARKSLANIDTRTNKC